MQVKRILSQNPGAAAPPPTCWRQVQWKMGLHVGICSFRHIHPCNCAFVCRSLTSWLCTAISPAPCQLNFMTAFNREMKGLTPPKWHHGYFKLRTSEQTAAEGGKKKNNFLLICIASLSKNSAAITQVALMV